MSKGDKHEGAVATCPLQATLAYRYTDGWRTQIHQFAKFDDKRAGKGGFVTGKPEYLIGGAGQTEAPSAAPGTTTNEYDARIYSHFSAGAISTIVGAPPKGSPDKEGHERTDIEKRRFLARSLELEVYLYLDSLRFWALDTFAFSREAGPSESPSPSSPSHQGLEDWVSAKRQYWSNVVSKREKTDPSLTLSSQTASDWWDNREDLHQVFVSLTNGDIIEIETELEDHVALVGKLLRGTVPGIDASNRFWAEGLCETVRETTLVPTVFPQVMEALICNIPARLWAIASPATGDMLLRIMARAAASLVYKLNRELHIASKDTGEEAFNAFLDSFRLPAKESLPEHLQHIHELVARIENINDLIALHAAALHDCFTESIVVKPQRRTSKKRTVNGARPATSTQVLCFRPPGASKQNKKGCDSSRCAKCRKNTCDVLPCGHDACRAKTVTHREFMRQLREQQATLNGTRKDELTSNREVVGSNQLKANKRSKSSSPQTTAGESVQTPPPGQSQAQAKSGNEKEAKGTALVREEEAQKAARKTWHEERTEELLGSARKKHSENKETTELPWDEKKGRAEAESQATRELSENLAMRLSSRVKELKKKGISEHDLVQELLNDEELLQFAKHIANKEELTKEDIKALRNSDTFRYKGLAALHALDIFAGGNAFQLLGLGDGRVNSSIGGQWTANAKRTALNDGLKAANEYPNFELVVCPPVCELKKASSSANGTNKGTTP